ncbi:MAG: hypothetical protein NZ805_15205 [Armatimonadetes bacterium]|nr:hypothetical protein [Armatimonadota bacterium]MCS7266167.1 hypothetical protein [Armatimonadota bacterium]
MPKYVGVYTTACLTRKQLENLVKQLLAGDGDVRCEKAYASTVSGQLICVFRASSKEAMDDYQKQKGLMPDQFWRIDLETQNGDLMPIYEQKATTQS